MKRWFDIYKHNFDVTFNDEKNQFSVTLINFDDLSAVFLPIKNLNEWDYDVYEMV